MTSIRRGPPPRPGEESVWDYPRPAVCQPTPKRVRVIFGGVVIADTTGAWRVLETSHPPTYYLPPHDIRMEFLTETDRRSLCEWKGLAQYFHIKVGDRFSRNAAWCYPEPTPAFEPIKDYVAFYPSRMDECWVGTDKVRSQAGDFYGGWVTPDLVGPFKGEPGTEFW